MNIEDIIKSESTNAISRTVDELGRVVIPIDFRNRLLKNNNLVYMEVIRDYIILKIEDKENEAIRRELDKLGRLTILKEIRDMLNIKTEDQMLVWTYENFIILRKKEDKCIFCQRTDKLIKHKEKFICEKCLKTLNKIGKALVK